MSWLTGYDHLMHMYVRPIVHMRAQHNNKRLSLLLGSGVSKPLGVPNWEELVYHIAKKMKREALIKSQMERSSITSKIQLLFEYFQMKGNVSDRASQNSQKERDPFVDPGIKKRWHEIIRECLYETVTLEANKTVRSYHPYLGAFFDVICRSPITVNYNFDDFVERMLSERNKEEGKPVTEGYESVWDINLQFRSNSVIIYHPNGYLPRDPLEKSSNWLVFSEDEYADQLIYSTTGYFSSLAHHLSKSTCLLIGLSLEDSTLRHLLRQNARMNPGHYHYHVAFVKDSQKLDPEEVESIRAANFEVYNLITLCLTNEEIKCLGKLITMDDQEFRFNATKHRHNIKYCFYITGAIGAGKSTVTSYFRSLQTHDEWTERRLPDLAKYPGNLSPEEEKAADDWIGDQFHRKNWNLIDCKDGIHVVDRSPLDPLGFTEKTKWPKKASFLLNKICRKRGEKIEPGQVILLDEDPQVLRTRIKPAQEGYTLDNLKEQQGRLAEVYTVARNAMVLCTRGRTMTEVVKGIARIIHMQEYEPVVQLHNILKEIAKGGKDA
jgi:hypothetical protein